MDCGKDSIINFYNIIIIYVSYNWPNCWTEVAELFEKTHGKFFKFDFFQLVILQNKLYLVFNPGREYFVNLEELIILNTRGAHLYTKVKLF